MPVLILEDIGPMKSEKQNVSTDFLEESSGSIACARAGCEEKRKMKEQRLPKRARTLTFVSILGSFVVLTLAAAGPIAEGQSPAKPSLDSDKVLTRPEGYRKWIYMGTPLTPNDMNPPEAPFPEFHNVYIHPDDYAHYERTGEFQDGTVIVKELVTVGSKKATSGNGYFMGEFIGLEAAVKDSRRFPNEPGNWAYYSFGHSYPLKDAVAPQATQTCNACHSANAEQDWVFTQYYPVVRAARPMRESQ